MMRIIPRSLTLLKVLVLVVGAVPTAAWGQNKIPYEAVTSVTALSPEYIRLIDVYVAQRVERLIEGDPKEIRSAREGLLDPLGLVGASDVFLVAYSRAVSSRLSPGVNLEKPLIVRLNVMIIAAALRDPGVARVIEAGLDDENPAVRYWACKAAGRVSSRGTIPGDVQLSLLNKLSGRLSKETDPAVSEQVLRGLVGLSIPEATEQLLTKLNEKVQQFAAQPQTPAGVVVDVLRTLFVNAVRANATGQRASEVQLRRMMLVGYRYMDLSSTLLDLGLVGPGTKQEHIELLQITDAMLIWAAGQSLPGGRSTPDSVKRQIELGNWPAVRLRAQEWKLVLVSEPLNFKEQDLVVSFERRP